MQSDSPSLHQLLLPGCSRGSSEARPSQIYSLCQLNVLLAWRVRNAQLLPPSFGGSLAHSVSHSPCFLFLLLTFVVCHSLKCLVTFCKQPLSSWVLKCLNLIEFWLAGFHTDLQISPTRLKDLTHQRRTPSCGQNPPFPGFLLFDAPVLWLKPFAIFSHPTYFS